MWGFPVLRTRIVHVIGREVSDSFMQMSQTYFPIRSWINMLTELTHILDICQHLMITLKFNSVYLIEQSQDMVIWYKNRSKDLIKKLLWNRLVTIICIFFQATTHGNHQFTGANCSIYHPASPRQRLAESPQQHAPDSPSSGCHDSASPGCQGPHWWGSRHWGQGFQRGYTPPHCQ